MPLVVPADGALVWAPDAVRGVDFPVALTAAQIAGPPDLSGLTAAPEGWDEALAVAAADLETRGCATVPALLPQHLVAAVGDYYRRALGEGLLRFDAGQSQRFFAHRDPLAEWMHTLVGAALRPVLGDRYKPSYTFVAAYLGGASVRRHTDRPQCEVTVSMCVEATPGARRWPLLIEMPSEEAVLDARLGVGHAVVFKGRDLPHARSTLGDGERYITILFHFAAADFDGDLD